MVDLIGHETGNGGYSQRTPTALPGLLYSELSLVRTGVAPERMPKADATGLAPKKSADHNPPVHDSFVREGLAYSKSQSSLFLW